MSKASSDDCEQYSSVRVAELAEQASTVRAGLLAQRKALLVELRAVEKSLRDLGVELDGVERAPALNRATRGRHSTEYVEGAIVDGIRANRGEARTREVLDHGTAATGLGEQRVFKVLRGMLKAKK